MARLGKNSPLHNGSGAIAKQIVIKQYPNKTVVTAFPDMSKVKPSKPQTTRRKKFAEAVAYAKAIVRDPVLKAQYQEKVAPGQTVYNYAISEYSRMHP